MTALGVACVLLLWGCNTSPSIPWTKDYSAALSRAASENLPIITYLYTDWCSYCAQMERSTFQDPLLTEDMADRYIWVKLNAETDPVGVELSERYMISGYPTTFLMDYQGQELDRMEGYKTAREFKSSIEEFADSPNSFGNLRRQAEASPQSVSAQYALAEAYMDRGDFVTATKKFVDVIALGGDDHIVASAHYYLAYILTQAGQLAKALEQLDQLRMKFPESPVLSDASVLRGRIYYLNGQNKEARKVFEDFLATYPDHGHRQMVRQFLQILNEKSPSSMPMVASH